MRARGGASWEGFSPLTVSTSGKVGGQGQMKISDVHRTEPTQLQNYWATGSEGIGKA
jgi:hypothetical protein